MASSTCYFAWRLHYAYFLFIWTLFAAIYPETLAKNCLIRPTKKNPVEIDLTPLTVKIDYIAKSIRKENVVYHFNVCGSIEETGTVCSDGTMVCQTVSDASKHIYGKVSNFELKHAPDNDKSVTAILLTEGETCLAESKQRYSTEIQFKCSKGGFIQPTVLEEEECFVNILFPTPYACGEDKKPPGGSVDVGAIIAILIFVLPIAYLIFGAGVMFARGASGRELIVHREFLADLPNAIAVCEIQIAIWF
eukprot:gene10485-2615_t